MKSELNYDFYAYPAICSGLKALETISRELHAHKAVHPIVLSPAKKGQDLERLLRNTGMDSEILAGPACRITQEPTREDISTILKVMKESGNDAIIALGSGIVQSVAKLLNIMVSCDITMDELDQLPCEEITTFPHIAVLDEHIDGREATNRLLIDEFRLHHRVLYPDYIVIDDRVLKGSSTKDLAASAVLTLTQLCETYRSKTITPVLQAWTKSSFHFLAEYTEMKHTESRTALINAAAAAQLAHSNGGFGPVTTLSEMFAISRFCTEAQAAATLLPYFIYQLDTGKDSALDSMVKELMMIDEHQRWDKADSMIIEILDTYKTHIEDKRIVDIISSMVRQNHRLLKHTGRKEIQTLIDDLVANSNSPTASGGEA